MKNNKLKSVAIVMSLVVGATPAFACSSCPRANTSTRNNLIETIPTSAPAAPTPSTATEPKKEEATKGEVTKEETKKEEATKEETKKGEAKKEEATKGEVTKEETKKEEGKKEDVTETTDTTTAFTIDNFKVIQSALITLGVKQEDLEVQIKEGKKLVDVLESSEISVKKFRKQLIKEYSKVIKEGQNSGQLTKEEAKTLKQAVKEKVESWMSESK